MKNFKQKVFILIILLFSISICFMGCDQDNNMPPDPREPFFGIWEWESNGVSVIMTINSNLYQLEFFGMERFDKIINPLWTESINIIDDTKDEFSSGFTLSGVWSNDTSNRAGVEASVSLYINSSNDKISFDGTPHEIFNKRYN